jgi:hypothetical protein
MAQHKLTHIAALAFIGLTWTGCHHGAYAPKNTTKYDLENKEPFVLLEASVQRSITCSGLQKRTDSDGRLEVAANIRNRESRRIQVQISCEFKDEQGFVVDTSPFQNFILSPLAQEPYRVIALNSKAKAFTIRVREAQ